MTTGLIVSVSGIRGVVGEGLTAEAATAFAAALGTWAGGGKVVLSRDGRPSGELLRHAVIAGLLGVGCRVEDVGIAPTPTFGVAVRKLGAAAGVQITASHNPAPWNGLKLFGPEGMVLPPEEGRRVKALFDSRTFHHARWDRLGGVSPCDDALSWHLNRVLELVDVAKVQSRSPRVFLDANGGAGGPLGRMLLESLQARATVHAGDADGVFLHEPEPLAQNLVTICPMVPANGADVGFVLDPDADRLALIDETGRYVGEELTLALAVLFRLGQQRGPVAVNMSTSRVVEDVAARFGCDCHRSAVGEANVVQAMRRVGAVIGGEGNGGVIDPRVGWVRDPFIGMAMILNLLAERRQKLSEVVAELPRYDIVKQKYDVEPSRLPGLFASLTSRWSEARANTLDGLRLDWPDRWVHVRPSNTEPVVRVIAEAPRTEDAAGLCDEVGRLLLD